jgi:hypothetical protein
MSDANPTTQLAHERARLKAMGLGLRLIAPGRATVDLDRAEAGVRDALHVRRISAADDDNVLGARCRIVTTERGDAIVLLEPSTEGRLAAALARFGEQHVVDYVAGGADVVQAAAAAGVGLSAVASGPFGPQRLVLGGPRRGPFVVIVDQAATIDP